MIAQQIIDDVARQLTGLKLSDTTDAANEQTLLSYLNLAKNQIALDTLLWLGGEVVPMTTANEYTLTTEPIQILDVYDDSLISRTRNSPVQFGYYQLSPSVIHINNPSDGENMNVNYYYTPVDYELDDVLDIPFGLHRSVILFMTSMAYDLYKTEKEQTLAQSYMDKYDGAVHKYMMKTDNGNTDTVTDIDLIKQKGLV